MNPVEQAEQAVKAGDLDAAVKLLQDGVRTRAADAKLRVFLFQLLCVQGQWQRAMTQLQVCGEMDASTLPMVNTYREALQCEALREAVFAGSTTPVVLGRPQAWVAWLVEALQADARGDAAAAERLRNAAFDAAPATAGTIDGTEFEWIADADSRLGPVLEAVVNGRYSWVPFLALAKVTIEEPADLRDLVWSAAHLEFTNGGETVALIPSRYPGSAAAAEAPLRLSRRTDWQQLADEHYRGLGQRMWTTSAGDHSMLATRSIELQPTPMPDEEADDEPAGDDAGSAQPGA